MVYQQDLIQQERDACGVGFVYRKDRTHATIYDALNGLAQMEHRGACGADGVTGDGAGILTSIPYEIFRDEGIEIGENDAVAVFFVPQQAEPNYRYLVGEYLASKGFSIKHWRRVPVSVESLGQVARKFLPYIEQLVIGPAMQENLADVLFNLEREYSNLRIGLTEHMRNVPNCEEFYVASLSGKTIVYKAMTTSQGLGAFYNDLRDERFAAQWAVFHRRFSTNTVSKWPLAQPFRLIAHNGEINTLQGNLNWLRSRMIGNGFETLVDWAGSDSSILDFAVESLIKEGDTIESAFMKLIPEAHEHHSHLKDYPEIEHFYEFFAPHQEPWDGPAMVVFSNGDSLGAILDRNGLRPARYSVYEDGTVVLASEAGLQVSTNAKVIDKGRLGPGQMIAIDINSGALRFDTEIKTAVAKEFPYGQWLLRERRALKERPFKSSCQMAHEDLICQQLASGYSREDVETIISTMALNETEPVHSMGDDAPLAVLSKRSKTLFDYFKQRFAQVTNPPIDPIRERLVMSLNSYIGRRSPNLQPAPSLAETIILPSPIINEEELKFIESLYCEYKWARCSLTRPIHQDYESDSIEECFEDLMREVSLQVENGASIIILSDRFVGPDRFALPVLAAVGAVHHYLINCGLRLKCSLIVETSQCWTSHQVACLMAFGAQAILPYVAFETIRHWYHSEKVQNLIAQAKVAEHDESNDAVQKVDTKSLEPYRELTAESAQANYKSALDSGLLKILSKMGVSKLTSYVGAQIFECIGLGNDILKLCFRGTVSHIGGLTLDDMKNEMLALHSRAFSGLNSLIDEGNLKQRTSGEFHRNNSDIVKALHGAVKLKDNNADDESRMANFQQYSTLLSKQQPASLRDLFWVDSDRAPISIDDVEPVENILKKFCTGGMSLGALSKESHETLAVAMNRIGARSNCGEGGEDPLRYKPLTVEEDGTCKDFPALKNLRSGDSAASKIRQVASARFGVTPEYLATAEQLEIKIAQGAKPGEGGQLPAHKVSEYIARMRKTKSSMTLISPPPHHDIYSIEDLAQLIFDLKQVSKRAQVSVKLVSEQGVGTVALGCVKAGADIVHIAGHDGGTGAAPVGSIKHAGMPWELGLSEAHRFLSEHGMRSRTIVRVDGGLRCGTDIVKAALMGADEFAFGTIALIAQGCIMARVCHTNNCPVGVATQRESLRQRFHGNPDSVVAFFHSVAEEVRFLLAEMGYTSLDEIRGKVALLKERVDIELEKCARLDLSVLTKPAVEFESSQISDQSFVCGLNELIVNDPAVLSAVHEHGSYMKAFHITNTDRSVGASLSGLIATVHGDTGFEGQIVLNFDGTAGQSFGAFNSKNVMLMLKGEANDYVGKGMHGGEIVIRRSCQLADKGEMVLVGNTCLYGATGGKVFIAGAAGERFAVRNSRAIAVIEGVGDHGCEYMTGGFVLVIGSTGRNFGAGMTGGIAYVLDEDSDFVDKVNLDADKELFRLTHSAEERVLSLLEDHFRLTASQKARHILDNWHHFRTQFIQVVPPAERDVAGLTEGFDQSLRVTIEANDMVRDTA